MNIALTISCFLIFGFIHEGNGCCCTVGCSFRENCNIFGCNCKYEKCSERDPGSLIGLQPFWCDPNEKCSAKKFRRNMIEVN